MNNVDNRIPKTDYITWKAVLAKVADNVRSGRGLYEDIAVVERGEPRNLCMASTSPLDPYENEYTLYAHVGQPRTAAGKALATLVADHVVANLAAGKAPFDDLQVASHKVESGWEPLEEAYIDFDNQQIRVKE